MSFHYSEEIDLVVKLYEDGLLPEPQRKTFVDYISHFTLTGDDLHLLNNEELQTVFTAEELSELKVRVLTELLPKITEVRHKRENEFRQYNNDTAEEHMEEFFDKMNVLLEEFEGNEAITKVIEKEVSDAKNWINENDFTDNDERPDRVLDTEGKSTTITTTRSIFDDIDTIGFMKIRKLGEKPG
jgi:hypothetical protein